MPPPSFTYVPGVLVRKGRLHVTEDLAGPKDQDRTVVHDTVNKAAEGRPSWDSAKTMAAGAGKPPVLEPMSRDKQPTYGSAVSKKERVAADAAKPVARVEQKAFELDPLDDDLFG